MSLIITKLIRNRIFNSVSFQFTRKLGEDGGGGSGPHRKGLVLGVYSNAETKVQHFTPSAQQFNTEVSGKLEDMIRDGKCLTKGKSSVFQNIDDEYNSVAVVGLGSEDTGYNPLENLDECSENVRIAAATGAVKLQKLGISNIHLDGMGNSEAAAEGAALGLWKYQSLKAKENREIIPALELFTNEDQEGFQRGLFKAEAQNLARQLSDTPANLMTPAIFARHTVQQLCPCGINVEVRDRDWVDNKKMFAFLAVARGSTEPPVFLEISYCGGPQEMKPIVFVGKGITYDSGGLCIKKCKGMPQFRADMAGAAVIVAVLRAAAALSLPINIMAVIPLCENMPSGMAMKPGDIVFGLNGKTIRIDNTDNEGRLLLADALVYAYRQYKPRIIIDVATLTGGMKAALGGSATGVFTKNNDLWSELRKAGSITGDRVWRFPLWDHFTKKVTNIPSADVTNVGFGPGGGPCRAAAFLKEFVICSEWIHLDIASAGMVADTFEYPYLEMGRMTGRPTRTLIQFLYQIACPQKSAESPEM